MPLADKDTADPKSTSSTDCCTATNGLGNSEPNEANEEESCWAKANKGAVAKRAAARTILQNMMILVLMMDLVVDADRSIEVESFSNL
jgi:hypothetical protein